MMPLGPRQAGEESTIGENGKRVASFCPRRKPSSRCLELHDISCEQASNLAIRVTCWAEPAGERMERVQTPNYAVAIYRKQWSISRVCEPQTSPVIHGCFDQA